MVNLRRILFCSCSEKHTKFTIRSIFAGEYTNQLDGLNDRFFPYSIWTGNLKPFPGLKLLLKVFQHLSMVCQQIKKNHWEPQRILVYFQSLHVMHLFNFILISYPVLFLLAWPRKRVNCLLIL